MKNSTRMTKSAWVVLALLATSAVATSAVAASAVDVAAPARMSISLPSARPQQVHLQGVPSGRRLRIVDGVKELGVAVADRSGNARLSIGTLSPGSHTLHAVKWGTGEIAAEALHFMVPARPSGPLAPVANYDAGLSASALASGDLHGEGLPDLILAGASGIRLIHRGVPHTVDPHIVEWTAGSAPTAIAVLDANGDGQNDLAITTADGRVAILLNRGDDAFAPARYYAAGAHPSSIATADFNGDGVPDLAITNQDSNDISILYGVGDGTFKPATAMATGYSPRALIVADFNGDGFPDLATANFATNDVSILLGDGHGVFQPGVTYRAGQGPVSLAVADFDENGAPDLAVLNWIDGTVSLLMNNGSAVFQTSTLDAGASVTGMLVGDADGDGHSDLILHAGDRIEVRPGSGNGVFSQGYAFQSVVSPLLLTWLLNFEDRNAEGFPGFAAIDVSGQMTFYSRSQASSGTAASTRSGFISPEIRAARLDPSAQASSVVLTSSSSPIAFGKPVTLTATLSPSNATGRVVFYDGTTLLGMRLPSNGVASLTTNLLPSGARSLKAYYDGNGSYASSTSAVLVQTINDQSLGGFQPLVNYDASSGPYAVAVGDFNGDGKADLAVVSTGFYPSYSGSVGIYLGFGDGTYQAPLFYSTGTGSSFIAVADLNEDGSQDLVIANWSGSVTVLLGNGNGGFRLGANYPVGNSPYALAVGDFTGNGRASIAVANSGDGTVTLLLGNGDGTFSNGGLLNTGPSPQSIVVGDFNADGIADLAVACSDGVSILLGTGGAKFQSLVKYPAGAIPYSVATADFNGDGVADLAVANLNGGNVSVLLGNGNGTFRAPVNYSTGANAESVAIGDFNGDGLTDLAVANFGPASTSGGSLSVLYGNGNGTFRTPLTYAAGATPFFVTAGNLNGDASSDLAVIDLNGNSVGVLLGLASVAGITSPAAAPSVYIDSLTPGSTVTGTITVAGWAICSTTTVGTAIGNVQIKVDGAVIGTASYGGSRPDVCTVYPGRVGCPNVGFTYQLNTASLTSGIHTITVVATNTDSTPLTGSSSVNVSVIGVAALPPAVYIDSLASGATVTGTVTVAGWAIDSKTAIGTAISSVQVQVDGTTVGTATYGTPRSDVCVVYPGRPGCPNVGFTYQLNTASLSAGTHTITVVATDTDPVPDSFSFSLTVTVTPPVAHIDSLVSGATISGTVTVSGWAIDSNTAIGSVQVQVDGTTVGTAAYGTPRPDVCAVYAGRPGCPNVGFTYQLNTALLTTGGHTITVVATDTDPAPDSGSYSVPVTVMAAPLPLVHIDSLSSGDTVSGTVTVGGWAIDIGTAIGSVQVLVDGARVGTATYGVPRSDVCGVYPGRPGCPNVGFTYQLNTASLSAGSHTITVVATDTDATPDSGSFSLTVKSSGPSSGGPPPVVITSIVTVPNQNFAAISWNTDQASDSQVEYGLTPALGLTSPLNSTLVTVHGVTLSGLTPGTLYYYRVDSRNSSGSLTSSPQQTFTTVASNIATAPVILTIVTPTNNSVVANIASISGTASAAAGVASVNISIDGAAYFPAVGTELWYDAAFYAKVLPVGPHTVAVKAIDNLGNTASSTITVMVAHTNPVCSHSLVGNGIYCEQAATSATDQGGTSVTFPHGYTAGNLIVIGVAANDRHVPWVSSSISNTAGYAWKFWGNVTSGYLDDDLVQIALYYAYVPSTTNAPDTITVTKPTSVFTIEDALVYSGVGAIDGPGASAIGWGGPGVSDAMSGNYTVSVGDLNIGFAMGAPTIPGSGWTERLEDASRPFSEFADQIATSTVANATFSMNVDGYGCIGIAFKPANP